MQCSTTALQEILLHISVQGFFSPRLHLYFLCWLSSVFHFETVLHVVLDCIMFKGVPNILSTSTQSSMIELNKHCWYHVNSNLKKNQFPKISNQYRAVVLDYSAVQHNSHLIFSHSSYFIFSEVLSSRYVCFYCTNCAKRNFFRITKSVL